MSKQPLTDEDVRRLRERVCTEDQLLLSRSGLVLTLNGLMAIAGSFTQSGIAISIVASVIIAVNSIWIICATDANRYIAALSLQVKKSNNVPIDEQVRYDIQALYFRISSTRFISFWIPALLLVGWAASTLVALCTSLTS